ncbi:hypothetical protein KDL01_14560 [Actinospica durhamensis]|uniref:Uncharacterized protein n=1 Tax=Actinospica durhamensis TaxID=1508375 RepID=A0A941INY3_9ACTN|nr:hypothetical protein [Actinospica durhamensis]MBR7834494.1 hypothetical protein [Actinospica durhamensis]
MSQPQNPEPEAEDEVPVGDVLAAALVLVVTGTFAAAEAADASGSAVGVVAAGVADADGALLLVAAAGEELAEVVAADGLDAAVVPVTPVPLEALCPVGQTLGNGRVVLLVLVDAASAGVAT